VDYVALGAIAMNYYGIPKDAYKVEFLVSPEGIAEIHRALEHPYTTVFPFGRKKWVNTAEKVSIDFYVSGEVRLGIIVVFHHVFLQLMDQNIVPW
jgi:hypothetical protein